MPVTSPYRVIICDLRTDQLLDILPVTGVTFDDFIGKTGSCTGTVEITDPQVAARMRLNFLPTRTAIYVVRNADIWWGGIVWTRNIQSDGRGYIQVQFQASTFDSYLDHRRIINSLAYTGEDQLDIARALVDYAQSFAGGDIGLTYDQTFSGIARDRAYSSYDLPVVREMIDQLADVQDGFEWRIRAYSDNEGRRIRHMQLGYPKISTTNTEIMLSAPGEIIGYSLPEDGTTVANYWQSRGAATGSDASADQVPLMTPGWYYPSDLDAGWPRLDGSSDYNTVTDLATLNQHAIADVTRRRKPIVIPDIQVMLDARKITPSLIGTNARIRIMDIWYYEGVTLRYRIVGFKVQPPERGKPETASLYLEAL